MPYAKKQCIACDAFFEPTSGRQIVCTILECQIWWAQQPRPGESPEQTAKRSAARVAQTKSKALHPPDKERIRLGAIDWRRDNVVRSRELDKASKKRRRDKDLDADRRRERDKRRRQRAANPEKAKTASRESSRRRREQHPDLVKADCAEWRANNPEKVRANTDRWRRENPDKARALWARRDARIRGANIVETVNRIQVAERDNWICNECKDPIDPNAPYQLEPGKNNPEYLNIDHWIPVSKGGDHSYANSYATHAKCNNKKNAKMPDELA